jgi:hypothetical protein
MSIYYGICLVSKILTTIFKHTIIYSPYAKYAFAVPISPNQLTDTEKGG